MIFWLILFWIATAALVHSYIIYPWLLKKWSVGRSLPELHCPDNDLPMVSVLMAAYNEEKVIRQKIESIFQSDYPKDKLELVVGSDGSTDATNAIINEFISKGHQITFRDFGGRTGKSGIINQIYPLAKGSIFIPTDANIMFSPGMVRKLVDCLSDPLVGLVGANIINTGMQADGISLQEEAYIKRENIIKYREGLLWGTMMGAFGACYAIRKVNFHPIPANFLMEDFHITLQVIQDGSKAICDLKAIAQEDVSNLWQEEFKRKIRISAGNYQNLSVFYPMLWPFWKPAGYCFLSHKFLRWMGPFFLSFAIISSFFLMDENLFYTLAFGIQIIGLVTPLADMVLGHFNMHNFALRLVAYFYLMNTALVVGLWKYWKGISTSAWNPTARNIKE